MESVPQYLQLHTHLDRGGCIMNTSRIVAHYYISIIYIQIQRWERQQPPAAGYMLPVCGRQQQVDRY